MNAITTYFKESLHELKLVTWPKQEELLRLTIITVVFVIISAALIGLLDYGLGQAYQWLLELNQSAA